MANAFDQFDAPAAGVGPSANPFDQFGASGAADPSTTPVYSGSILPLTKYADGHVGFDSHAGVAGMARNFGNTVSNLVSFPHKAMTGEVDPNGPEGIAWGANLASLASPMTPGMMAGDLAIPGVANALRPAKVATPDAEALFAANSAGHAAANDMGVRYTIPGSTGMVGDAQDVLNNKFLIPEVAPQTHAILNKAQNVPPDAVDVPFGGLDQARQMLGDLAATATEPKERAAAAIAKQHIVDFLQNPDPANVLSGPAGDAAAVIKDATANGAAAFRSNKLNGIEDTADLRADATGSGRNIGNTVRGRIASLLTPPTPGAYNPKVAGFNQAEIDALRGVTEGTSVSNAARTIGNKLAGGGGAAHTGLLLGGLAAGHEAAGVPGAIIGAALPTIGSLAKALDNHLTTGRLSAADEMTRQRSPLYQALLANAPQEAPSNLGQNALLRALLSQGAPASSPQQ